MTLRRYASSPWPASPHASASRPAETRHIAGPVQIRSCQEALNGEVVDWMEHVSEEQYRK